MHEKDIELTQLLLSRQHEIETSATSLQTQLTSARADLDTVVEETRQRDVFESVLAKAADLLDRPDLQVEPPDLTQKEVMVESLANELEGVTSEIGKVRDLVDELHQKAPDLVAAAAAALDFSAVAQEPAEVPPFESRTIAAPAEAPQPEVVEAEAVVEYEPAVEVEAVVAAEAVVEPVQAPPASAYPGLPVLDLNPTQVSELLAAFNLDAVMQNEVFSHGHGTLFIVDAQSIFENVESYGFHSEINNQNEINNRLALEFAALAQEVSGSFHIIFNGDFQPDYDYSSRVAADYVEGGEPVPKEDLYGRILHLVEKYTGMLKTVCAITADQELAELLIGKGAHFIPITELFK